jgi:hypothetical protein
MELERQPLHLPDHRVASFPLGREFLDLLALEQTLLFGGQPSAVPARGQVAIGAELEILGPRKRSSA